TRVLECIGGIPLSPTAVGSLGAHSRGGGWVGSGQCHQRERRGLTDLLNGLAGADIGQRLLRERGLVRYGRGVLGAWVAGDAVERPRQQYRGRQHRGEQQRRRTTTASHGAMLRMSRKLPVFRHAPQGRQRHRRARRSLRCRLAGWSYGVAAGAAGTAGVAGSAAGVAPLIACMIDGTTTPLRRSIAWVAPSCDAALDSSFNRPPLAGAPDDKPLVLPSDGSPRIE